MPITFNLRHLEQRAIELQGELTAADLDLVDVDELIQVAEPVKYELVAERLGENILVQGQVRCELDCQCVRCLRSFRKSLEFDQWICDLPLSGEEKVTVTNDCVDLTPYLREDILLAFPQHPLCEQDCRGLLHPENNLNEAGSVEGEKSEGRSAWAELNKLKF